MITIFSIPKAFEGHIGIIQRNAIVSWTKLKRQVEIILLGNDSGVAEICKEFQLKHVPDVKVNEYGTPLCSDAFKKAQEVSEYSRVAFVNTDIILTESFVDSSLRCSKFEKYLMIGQRYDLDVTELINFENNDWEEILRNKVQQHGILHKPTGIDYFSFKSPEWFDMPPFAVGRPAWDNWLVSQAVRRGHAVIDATKAAFVIHQNHEHVKGVTEWKDGREEWSGPESAENKKLADENGKTHSGFTTNATWIMNSKGVLKCQ